MRVDKEDKEKIKRGDMKTLREVLTKHLEESAARLLLTKDDHRYHQGITQTLKNYLELL